MPIIFLGLLPSGFFRNFSSLYLSLPAGSVYPEQLRFLTLYSLLESDTMHSLGGLISSILKTASLIPRAFRNPSACSKFIPSITCLTCLPQSPQTLKINVCHQFSIHSLKWHPTCIPDFWALHWLLKLETWPYRSFFCLKPLPSTNCYILLILTSKIS